MNTILNKKWVAWVVLALFLLNISALSTILIYTYRAKPEPEIKKSVHQGIRPGKEIINELGLDSSQARVFHHIRSEFFDDIKPSLEKLQQKRKIIIDEINKDNPDTVFLNAVADTMGKIQADLKKETLRHYFRVRKICNEQQRSKLSDLYSGMFMIDEGTKGPGMGMRYQHGRKAREGDHQPEWKGRGKGGRWQHNDSTVRNN